VPSVKERVPKMVWRLIIGGAVSFWSFQRLLPFLGAPITVEPALYIALLAVSLGLVGGAFD
jgi:hypothetical protein